MSSPLANRHKSLLEKLLVGFHQRVAHQGRLQRLCDVLGAAMVHNIPPKGEPFSLLDVGCGDMRLSESLAAAHGAVLTCLDVYPAPVGGPDASRWRKYREFDGKTLDFPDGSFDVVLLVDVLHHVEGPVRAALLQDAVRVGRHVLVKDHFQYGPISNATLRLMDFIGNWGYGVSVPRRYFTQASFAALCAEVGAKEATRRVGIDLYDNRLMGCVARPEYQFVSVLTAR